MEEITLVDNRDDSYVGMLEFMRMMSELAPEAGVCVPWTDLIRSREQFMSSRFRDRLDELTRELEQKEYIRFVPQSDGRPAICVSEKGRKYFSTSER